MALDEVARLIEEKDGSQHRVYATLHELYLGEGAEKPSSADFEEKFELQLKNRGLDNSVAEEIVESVAGELDLEGGQFEDDPEEFAKELVKHAAWVPPAAAPAAQLTEVDGFLRDTSGRLFLSDGSTEVFEHTGYPGPAVYYDRQNRLYQHGLSYAPFTEVDGFARDGAGRMFLADRATEVFEHTGYPGLAVYYDRQNRLYQHGRPYAPAATATETAPNPATDAEIAELLNSDANYDELVRAVAAGELVIEYDDEDLDSFTADQFVNID